MTLNIIDCRSLTNVVGVPYRSQVVTLTDATTGVAAAVFAFTGGAQLAATDITVDENGNFLNSSGGRYLTTSSSVVNAQIGSGPVVPLPVYPSSFVSLTDVENAINAGGFATLATVDTEITSRLAIGSYTSTATVAAMISAALGAYAAPSSAGPSNLIATGQPSGSVLLNWNAAGGTVTDYSVLYRTSLGPGSWTTFAHAASTATTQTVTGLTAGTSYDFEVAAVNASTIGSYTAGPASATPTGTSSSGLLLPGALYSDTFNRADTSAGNVGYTDGGSGSAQLWYSSDIGISNHTVKLLASTYGNLTLNTGHAGGTHQVVLAAVPSTLNPMYLGSRLPSSTAQGFDLYIGVSSAGYTDPSGFNIAGVTPAIGDVLKIVDDGNLTVKVFINGTQVYSSTSFSSGQGNTGQGNTYAGLNIQDPTGAFKDWSYSTATS